MGLLSFFGERGSSYSGKESYRYVDRLLRSESKILIASPFIDDYYADFLRAHSRNKHIKILSSSIGKSAAKRIRRRPISKFLAFTSMLAIANAALFLEGQMLLVFVLLSVALAVGSLMYALRDSRGIELRMPKGFVHAKMYIGERTAIVGSTNLTYAGMHKNLEHIDIITDKGRIAELRRQFMKLWNEDRP